MLSAYRVDVTQDLTWTVRRMDLPFTEMEKTMGRVGLRRKIRSFTFVMWKFLTAFRYSNGDVKLAVRYGHLELREVWAGDTIFLESSAS